MQFPGMIPLQFAQGAPLGAQLQQFAKTAQPLAKAAGAPAVPTAPGAPMDISPAATNAGTNVPAAGGIPTTGILGLLQGMKPQGILSLLQGMSAPQAAPGMVPGAALFDRAGMLGTGGVG